MSKPIVPAQENKTMRPRKLEMKLPTSKLNYHRQAQSVSQNPSRQEYSSTSPTFARECCSKSVRDSGGSPILFDIPSTILTPHQSSHTNTHLMAMDHDCSCSSQTSSPSMVLDRMMENETSNTIGLPSDYPIHRNDTSYSSVALDEELEDFDIIFDETTESERAALHTSLSSQCVVGGETYFLGKSLTATTSGASSSNGNNDPTKKRHRRIPSDLYTLDACTRTTKTKTTTAKLDQAHHRRRNYALGQMDFNDSVLIELFGDVSIAEVRS